MPGELIGDWSLRHPLLRLCQIPDARRKAGAQHTPCCLHKLFCHSEPFLGGNNGNPSKTQVPRCQPRGTLANGPFWVGSLRLAMVTVFYIGGVTIHLPPFYRSSEPRLKTGKGRGSEPQSACFSSLDNALLPALAFSTGHNLALFRSLCSPGNTGRWIW